MKTTGIVRRIDELGRIVIPKEVRKTLKIKSGEAIEISINEGVITLQKYSPLTFNIEEVDGVCQTLSSVSEKDVLITDTEKVICASNNLKGYINELITKDALKIIEEKKSLIISVEEKLTPIKLTISDKEEYKNQLIVPILNSEGEPFGIVAILDNSETYKFGSNEIKLARLSSKLLSLKI